MTSIDELIQEEVGSRTLHGDSSPGDSVRRRVEIIREVWNLVTGNTVAYSTDSPLWKAIEREVDMCAAIEEELGKVRQALREDILDRFDNRHNWNTDLVRSAAHQAKQRNNYGGNQYDRDVFDLMMEMLINTEYEDIVPQRRTNHG